MLFELKDGKVKLEYASEGVKINETAFLRFDELKAGGNRFSFGKIFKNINGLNLTESDIENIKETRIEIEVLIKEFLNRKDIIIKELNYNHLYIENAEKKEMKSLSSDIYNTLEKKFFDENKKFFIEINRTIEAYEDDVVYYAVQESIEIEEVEEIVKTISLKESKNETLKENEKIITKIVIIDDIDYGKMEKCIYEVCKMKTIKIKRIKL